MGWVQSPGTIQLSVNVNILSLFVSITAQAGPVSLELNFILRKSVFPLLSGLMLTAGPALTPLKSESDVKDGIVPNWCGQVICMQAMVQLTLNQMILI